MNNSTLSSRVVLAVAVMVACNVTSAQPTYRCTVGGQTVYQQVPCPGSGGTVADDVKAREEGRARELRAAAQAAEKRRLDEEQRVARDPCGDTGKRWDDWIRQNPQIAPSVLRKLDETAGIYVGMPEAAAEILLCSAIKKRNTTETAAGTNSQWVLEGAGFGSARYVYVRRGAVYAVQR